MTAKVICMASAKGGSGKTVLTATFGAFLASALNKKVLIIDTDAATNGLTLMHLKEVMNQAVIAKDKKRTPRGIYNLENIPLDNIPLDNIPLPTASYLEIVKLNNGVDLIPATYEFLNTENIDAKDYLSTLKPVISHFRQMYDYIFVDAQAGSDIYAQIAMSHAISDEVVIVSEYDPMSAAGVERLKGLFHDDLTPMRTWMLLNKMLPEFVRSFSDFLEVARYLSPIPWDADVVRAYARRKTALNLNVGNEYTLAVMKTLRMLLGEEVAQEIDLWANHRADVFRRPIKDQYEKLEQELEHIFMERKRREITNAKRETIVKFVLLLVSASMFVFIYAVAPDYPIIGKMLFFATSGLTLLLFTKLPFFSWLAPTHESDSKEETDKLREYRRQAYLEEKLRKLEALKDADFETIIKTDNNSA
ncbi:MAG: ParA family protein [Methylococcales bacterium]|nr:ParA family protein [Methylococcales bacterium]